MGTIIAQLFSLWALAKQTHQKKQLSSRS